MNANSINKVVYAVLGGVPVPDDFPEIPLRLPTDTAPLEGAAFILNTSLSADATAGGNATASAELTFSLVLPAADFDDARAAFAVEAFDARLCTALTAGALNLAAADLEQPVHFYFIRWKETPATLVEGDALLFQFIFAAKVQL